MNEWMITIQSHHGLSFVFWTYYTLANTLHQVQLNPAIAYFKGLVKIMLYTEVLFIANI